MTTLISTKIKILKDAAEFIQTNNLDISIRWLGNAPPYIEIASANLDHVGTFKAYGMLMGLRFVDCYSFKENQLAWYVIPS